MDARMLSPVLPAVFLAGIGALALARQAWANQKWISYVGVGLILVVAANYATRSAVIIGGFAAGDTGYTSRWWRQSQAFSVLRNLPKGTQLITNDPLLVLFYTDRFPLDLGSDIYWQGKSRTEIYREGPGATHAAFREGAGLALFFLPMQGECGDQWESRLADLTRGLKTAYLGPEMGLYFFPSSSP